MVLLKRVWRLVAKHKVAPAFPSTQSTANNGFYQPLHSKQQRSQTEL